MVTTPCCSRLSIGETCSERRSTARRKTIATTQALSSGCSTLLPRAPIRLLFDRGIDHCEQNRGFCCRHCEYLAPAPAYNVAWRPIDWSTPIWIRPLDPFLLMGRLLSWTNLLRRSDVWCLGSLERCFALTVQKKVCHPSCNSLSWLPRHVPNWPAVSLVYLLPPLLSSSSRDLRSITFILHHHHGELR